MGPARKQAQGPYTDMALSQAIVGAATLMRDVDDLTDSAFDAVESAAQMWFRKIQAAGDRLSDARSCMRPPAVDVGPAYEPYQHLPSPPPRPPDAFAVLSTPRTPTVVRSSSLISNEPMCAQCHSKLINKGLAQRQPRGLNEVSNVSERANMPVALRPSRKKRSNRRRTI